MIKDILQKTLNGFGLSELDTSLIISKFSPLKLKKGDCFSEYGKTSNKIGILIKGFLAAYYDSEGKEIVSRFYFLSDPFSINDNFIISSHQSFTLEEKSNEQIIALEECLIACISKDDLEELYEKVPQMNHVGRLLAEYSYNKALQRAHLLQVLPIENRVKQLRKMQPGIFKIAKIQDIASYLAVNRNAISDNSNKKKGN